jgi:type II secretory pathway component GspD/PulD (secretin)
MKAPRFLTFASAVLAAGILHAQNPADQMIEPVVDAVEARNTTPVADLPAAPAESAPAQEEEPSDLPPPTDLPATPPGPQGTPGEPAKTEPFGPLEQQKQEMQKSDEGFIIKDASLNDIFQFLAKSAGRQYFHNSKIAGPDFMVTGHLNDGNPLQQMEELSFMYGLSLHTKGNTIYALTQAQLSQLPSSEFHYQLRYLRPTDMEKIEEIIKPMLSPGTGIVKFEPKTNTIVIIDTAHRIEQARDLLHGIDKAKGQIIVETKILRINSSAAERMGVNWSSSLGQAGVPIAVTRDLGSIFGLPMNLTGIPAASGTPGFQVPGSENLVLNPVQLSGVLRALAEGEVARQISNPTLITEDNEQATISIIDRVPIITSTVQQGSGTSGNITTDEVRYTIDEKDKTIDADPDKHREIGISLVVTPTLLPDGTVRMKMRPRSAQIVGQVTGASGNVYPRVTEAMIESLARVPDGFSLVIGGFYGATENNDKTKVPFLGDLPVMNFFFKSKEAVKERSSLVFIVTPKSYQPSSSSATKMASNRIRSVTDLECDYDWVDPENPGPAHEANLRRTIRGAQPTEAPFFPRTDEPTDPFSTKSTKSTQPRFGRGGRR